MPQTYSSYLRLQELLELQSPLSEGPEHDEMLFIVIHQVYELWFKLVLHEMDLLQEAFESGDGIQAGDTLKRILTVLKTLVGQIDILETMTPVSFVSFRERLEASSGFQSFQFREFEFRLGARNRSMIRHHEGDAMATARLEAAIEKPSIYDSFLRFLQHCGYEIPEELFDRESDAPSPESEDVRKALVSIYRNDPPIRDLCERLVDLDEGIQEWRYRHVKMVERTIGAKKGTGGSSGTEYLKSTLFKSLFPDLWTIRADL